MITFRQKGNFTKSTKYMEKLKTDIRQEILDKYGKEGIFALQQATPVDSGDTSNSWYYKIERNRGHVSICFYNSNIQNGVPIAIILQYGHATKNGGWVQGRDYINPAIRPIFDKMADSVWREVREYE